MDVDTLQHGSVMASSRQAYKIISFALCQNVLAVNVIEVFKDNNNRMEYEIENRIVKWKCFLNLFRRDDLGNRCALLTAATRHLAFRLISTVLLLLLSRSVYLTHCDPIDYSPPGSSVHRILQARILELVAMPSCRGSFQLKDQTWVFCTVGRLFTSEPPGKPLNCPTED